MKEERGTAESGLKGCYSCEVLACARETKEERGNRPIRNDSDSEEDFEATYEAGDEDEDGDEGGETIVKNVVVSSIVSQLIDIPPFMRRLDLNAMHAPEFSVYANIGVVDPGDEEFRIKMEYSFRKSIVAVIRSLGRGNLEFQYF
ncbi:hypothetical protein AHAS_Ahas13G0334700 [Arachis hypogaea]